MIIETFTKTVWKIIPQRTAWIVRRNNH